MCSWVAGTNANTENAGSTYTGVLRDVSVNGAFIAGQALPSITLRDGWQAVEIALPPTPADLQAAAAVDHDHGVAFAGLDSGDWVDPAGETRDVYVRLKPEWSGSFTASELNAFLRENLREDGWLVGVLPPELHKLDGSQIALHRHLALNHTFVVQGEHRIYEPDGRLRLQLRPGY